MAELSYREALNTALKEEMDRDPEIMILGEEVAFYQGTYKVTRGLYAEYGENRIKDTPISEEMIVGAAVGAAMSGLRPIAEIMTINFTLLAMDQIVNHAAKIRYMFGGQAKVPLVIRTPQGAGNQLGAQHSQHLEAYFVHCPGIRVVVPSSPADAKGLLKSAIRDDNPVLFIEDQNLYNTKGEVPNYDYIIPLGIANIARTGEDVTLISYSKSVQDCLQATKILEDYDINAEVIDLRCLNPVDTTTIFQSVKKTGLAVIVNEAWKTGSVASEISSLITENCFQYLESPVLRICAEDVPMPYNKTLEKAALPSVETIVNSVLDMLKVEKSERA